MLILNDHLVINFGKTRVCYEHPSDPNLVVKTALKGDNDGELSNEKEMKAYKSLMISHIDLSCISHCYDFASTNRGKGLLCQCIRDDDGSISKSLWDIILYQDDCKLDYIQEVTSRFCDHLIEKNVFLFDLNLKNIVLQLQHDGTYKPYAIDLKSRFDTKEFIPFSKYSKYFARKKLIRRTKQLVDRIRQYYQLRAELIEGDKKQKRAISYGNQDR
jgi:hypothetical protein